MSIFSREKYALIDMETKETVWEGKDFVEKETILKDIDNENLAESMYRLELWHSGRKVKNEWVMKKARKKATAEELAAKSREEAEAFIAHDAQDIKDRVEAHKLFAQKVKETYNIESSAVDQIVIPSGKDGTLGIIEAVQLATAQSAFIGIRETNPTEVAATVKSIMNSGTTIFAAIAQMLANRITESKKKPAAEKKEEKKKVELPKEAKKEQPKKEQPKKEQPKPKEVETHKEVVPKEVETHKEIVSDGVTKTTFGTDENTSTNLPESTTSSLVYEDYKLHMLGSVEEHAEEEPITE